jgi:Ca-activated chloride channel homolog
MKCRLVLFGLLCCIAILPQLGAQDSKDKAKDTKEPEKTDITAAVREMNSDKYVGPPTQFRTGHVNAKALDAKAIKKTDVGFTIQMPSGAPIPTPTVYKDKLFVSGGFSTKEYFCFHADDGKFVWGMSLDDDGPTSAVCGDDIVVFNTESCTIFALDANTGKQIWSYFLGDPLTSTPTIANGKVFTSYPANAGGAGAANQLPNADGPKAKPNFKIKGKDLPPEQQGAGDKPAQGGAKQRPNASHAFICLDLKSGKILWQKWIDSDVMSAPVAVDDEVYATTFAGTVYKFKQKDGEIISAHKSRATSAPVIVGNNMYWTQRADKGKDEKCAEEIAGLDRDKVTQNFATAKREAIYLDGKTQAKAALGKVAEKLDAGNGLGAGMAGPAGYDNVGQGSVATMQAFQGSRILNFMDNNYNCMGDELVNTDPKDGKIRWKVKVKGDLAKQGGHLAAPPAAAGGQLFLATVEGEVLQVDPEKGGVTKTYKVGSPVRSQPAIENGRIYVGTQDGKLVCINTGDTRFTGWPTWGANMAHTNIVEAAKK